MTTQLMTNSSPCKGPIFIVGAPRSGTTLLQYMLRSHPAISLPTGESNFIVPLFRRQDHFGDLSREENIRRVLEAMEAQSAEFLHTDLHGLRFDAGSIAHTLADQGCKSMRDVIGGLFALNASGEGKQRWGDKTPYYVLHIPKLLEWWPDAQIIHLVRDGRDVAMSMFARCHDFRTYNIYSAAKQWEQYVEAGRAFGRDLYESQYLELRYEDMLSDQAATLQRICDFLGEAYSDDLLEYKKAGVAGKTPLLQKPVQKDNQDKWKTGLSARQIRVFESAGAESLEKFGYKVMTSGKRLPLPFRAALRWHNSIAASWFRRFGPKRSRWAPPAASASPAASRGSQP